MPPSSPELAAQLHRKGASDERAHESEEAGHGGEPSVRYGGARCVGTRVDPSRKPGGLDPDRRGPMVRTSRGTTVPGETTVVYEVGSAPCAAADVEDV